MFWVEADAARAFRRARVSLLGRRPLTPFRTGSGGRGVGRRYEDCMDRRVGLDGEEEEGARRGFGRVTAQKGETRDGSGLFYYYNLLNPEETA